MTTYDIPTCSNSATFTLDNGGVIVVIQKPDRLIVIGHNDLIVQPAAGNSLTLRSTPTKRQAEAGRDARRTQEGLSHD